MHSNRLLRIGLLTLLVLVCQATWTLAGTTGSISGKVTDQNGNGLAGAKVTASSPGQSLSVTSGSNGFYSILNLSPDTYSVTTSKDGYDTATVYGITVTADQSSSTNVVLRTTVKTIGHITTTATASVVSKTITGDLYAVNAQAINGYQGSQGGAETLYSQNGVVGSLPGVVRYAVGTGGGYGGQGQLSLRGGAPDQVGYELDGVPLNRGFDFYNGTGFVTNGLASLQVYTGGAPADAGRAMSGYINQVFQRGRYPGGADFTAVVGSPLYNHTVQADVFGATPDSRFTYYVSTLATNAYFNFGDRSNLANTSYTVPAGDLGCGAFNMGLTPANTTGTGAPGSGNTLNCSQANILNQPVSSGAYASVPFNAGRDTTVNLHWAFQHGGLNDDLQALYLTGTTMAAPYGLYGTHNADPSQASTNYSGDGVGPNNSLTWPTGHFYYGVVGQPYNPALRTALSWPTSNGSVDGVIPPTFQDSQTTQYSINKVAYTRSLTQASFLRAYGYTMYSSWSLDQPINGVVGSSFYQLHDNATGVTLNYQNQLNSRNLFKLIGDWSRDVTLRYNYFNYTGSLKCQAGGAPAPCAPGAIVTKIQGPASNWSTATPLDWDAVIADSWKPSDQLLFDLGLRWDTFGYQLMAMKMNGPDGIAYLSEEQDGVCLHGYNYSPADPKIIGPNGNQNCHDLLTAPGTPTKDLPGAANWQDTSGNLIYRFLSPRFGVTWSPGARDVIRISVGRYVQPSNSAFEQYRNAPFWGPGTTVGRLNSFYDALGFTVIHNALPMDSTNYDLSLEHEFGGGVSMKLTPYFRNTRNQILNLPVNPQSPTFITGYNFGNARIKGVEFLLSKNVQGQSGIGGTLATTYTDSKIRFNKLNGSSYIDVQNGIGADGLCIGAGICGYNAAYGTNYALLDPNGLYSPSFVQAPSTTGPSWDVRWVVNLSIDARLNGFDVVPTFNFQSGNPYGDPLNFPDAHCNPAAGFSPSGCTPLPAGKAFYGGNGPNPYTNTFDAPGSLHGPSWWALNLAVSHDIGHNLKASILGTNLLSGVHNHGYPWELATNQNNISYADNGGYNSAPLGAFAATTPSPAQAYYGNNYFPYTPAGILPLRDYVFSVSAKI